jgi:AraC-like DNA-binding protein
LIGRQWLDPDARNDGGAGQAVQSGTDGPVVKWRHMGHPQLNGMVQELAPPAALRATVDSFWARPSLRHPAATQDRILPDGCMDLIWRCAQGPDGTIEAGALLVSGVDPAPRWFAIEAGVAYAGVRFRPAEARRMLDTDASCLVGAGTVPATFSNRLATLEQRLGDCRSLPAVLERMGFELELLARETSHLRPPRRVRAAIEFLRSASDTPGVAAVANILGVTTRTLRREIVAWTGLPPKLLARIFRFQAALELVRGGEDRLADVAAAIGYADQAHMAREFRALAGAPPSACD